MPTHQLRKPLRVTSRAQRGLLFAHVAILAVLVAACATPPAASPAPPAAATQATPRSPTAAAASPAAAPAPTTGAAATAPSAGSPAAAAPAAGSAPAAAPAAGSPPAAAAPPADSSTAASAVARESGFALSLDGSEARYRAREQFVNVSLPNEAIGRTREVTGRIALDADNRVARDESRIAVDLRTLQSDQPQRDNYLRTNTLRVAQHPTAVFQPTEVRGLPLPLPASGAVSFQVLGDLTVQEVTRPVVWDVTAQVAGQSVSGTATAPLRFADFNLPVPRVARVLSIDEPILLELDFRGTLSPASGA
jgi:polyisoprenoid-binding protein YceI